MCLCLASFAFVALSLFLFSPLSWRSLSVFPLSVWPRCLSPPLWFVAVLSVPVSVVVVRRCDPFVWFRRCLCCSCLFSRRLFGSFGLSVFCPFGPWFVVLFVCGPLGRVSLSGSSCFIHSLRHMSWKQQICRNSGG